MSDRFCAHGTPLSEYCGACENEEPALADDSEVARLRALNAELVEALERLRLTAALLHQNAEGCAVNHYGADFQIHGMPGWLRDSAAEIARVAEIVSRARAENTGGESDG